MKRLKSVLVNGGCGFIGSHFIRYLFSHDDFEGHVINLDKLTYAGNRDTDRDIEEKWGSERYRFVRGDIVDQKLVQQIFEQYGIDTVVHFAAESHVDRSISGPAPFIHTNLLGTFNLLETARTAWSSSKCLESCRFHHVSTDEVFGSLNAGDPAFTESTPYDPRSPYSASKAGSDHLVRAYFHTYGLPVTISNCSNNYGPYQYPEKLIPVVIEKALTDQPIPIYGDGKNVRDWLYVTDHCFGIFRVLVDGRPGETFNFGGNCELANIDLVQMICDIMDERHPSPRTSSYRDLITFITDRAGHDRRYAIDFGYARERLDWRPWTSMRDGLRTTIEWYLNNSKWIKTVTKRP